MGLRKSSLPLCGHLNPKTTPQERPQGPKIFLFFFLNLNHRASLFVCACDEIEALDYCIGGRDKNKRDD